MTRLHAASRPVRDREAHRDEGIGEEYEVCGIAIANFRQLFGDDGISISREPPRWVNQLSSGRDDPRILHEVFRYGLRARAPSC